MNIQLTFVILLFATLIAPYWQIALSNPIYHIQDGMRTKTKGKVSKGKYLSPDKDFRISIPLLVQPGAIIVDQVDEDGVTLTLTDDFGFLYEVVSLKNEQGEMKAENAARAFRDIRESSPMKTSRGDELRIIAIEQGGSFLTENTAKSVNKDKIEWEERRPDLLSANAVFEANKRIYIIRAGVSLFKHSDVDRSTETAKKRLEEFISGLELLTK